MGEVISLIEVRQRKALVGENRVEKAFQGGDTDISARIAHIKASINRINKLMQDIRRSSQ